VRIRNLQDIVGRFLGGDRDIGSRLILQDIFNKVLEVFFVGGSGTKENIFAEMNRIIDFVNKGLEKDGTETANGFQTNSLI